MRWGGLPVKWNEEQVGVGVGLSGGGGGSLEPFHDTVDLHPSVQGLDLKPRDRLCY